MNLGGTAPPNPAAASGGDELQHRDRSDAVNRHIPPTRSMRRFNCLTFNGDPIVYADYEISPSLSVCTEPFQLCIDCLHARYLLF